MGEQISFGHLQHRATSAGGVLQQPDPYFNKHTRTASARTVLCQPEKMRLRGAYRAVSGVGGVTIYQTLISPNTECVYLDSAD